MFVAYNKELCVFYLDNFLKICAELGIPTTPHKTIWPDKVINFLGIELNSSTMMASLPLDKLKRFTKDILETLDRKKLTLRELKSLIHHWETPICNICHNAWSGFSMKIT